MFEAFLKAIEAVIHFFGAQLLAVTAYPLSSVQRIFWLYLATSVALAFYVYYRETRSDPTQGVSLRAFTGFLLPKKIWRSASAWLDVRYFFVHQIVRLVIYGAFLTGASNLMVAMVTGNSPGVPHNTVTMGSDAGDIAISLLYMFVLIGLVDLVSYGIHYLQHKIPLLWEFHKVHHSLEVMQPLSNYREHPVDNILYALGTGAAYGVVIGLAGNLFGYVPGMPMLLGVPLLVLAFNLLGYNLRHSHIWLRWPGNWSMAFASPAHHHIHHSCHPDHLDRNFAFIFPLWDVLFGTYLMPETDKDVRFGLSMDAGSDYKSCLGLYLTPFRNLWVRFSKR